MKIQNNTKTGHIPVPGNDKGIALVMVLIVSAIALAIMAGLVYMLISGTQVSGTQKRYKTALEAGAGGADITYSLIALRGGALDSALATSLGLAITTPNTCITNTGNPVCVALGSFTGLSAKLNLPTSCWSSCDSTMSITPGTSTTYDMSFTLGTAPAFTVYAKIADTVAGNSGGDEGLIKSGVVASGTGEVTPVSIPYLYTIEVDAENAANPAERAKLSILYQY